MARKIVFRVADTMLFRLAYEGFLATARGTTRQEHKLIDKIIAHLEGISEEEAALIPGFDSTDPATPHRRHLDDRMDGTLIFEDAEFEYFQRSIDQVVCAAAMSRHLTKLHDLIDAAERGDAKTLAKVA